ncbi:hypothetical protein VRB68_03295 [Pseudomonas trivialis]|uniref:hypothetical protein n=1 Tax=Pseudomonas trivialis TaxID=200450 RepID=UPI0030CCC393
MSDDLNWVRWWAFPWQQAHIDWLTQTGFVDTTALSRSHHGRVSRMFDIQPELPPPLSPALLQLVQIDAQSRDLILTLVNEVYNAPHHSRLNQEQLLWCQRLGQGTATGPDTGKHRRPFALPAGVGLTDGMAAAAPELRLSEGA